jgi:heterotetrameric sarcosine oxidase gamma subunit
VPDPRSPLALVRIDVPISSLTLTDLSLWVKFQVKAAPDGPIRTALGVPFGRTTRPAQPGGRAPEPGEPGTSAAPFGTLVVGAGPGEWLVLGAPEAAADLRTALTALTEASDEFASVVDLTHGRALVRLRGADSAGLLAKVCAVDLADSVTPDRSALRCSVARVVTDVIRDDRPDGTPGYLLHCERSSGQYLAECLLDAGAEFGITVNPFAHHEDRP